MTVTDYYDPLTDASVGLSDSNWDLYRPKTSTPQTTDPSSYHQYPSRRIRYYRHKQKVVAPKQSENLA